MAKKQNRFFAALPTCVSVISGAMFAVLLLLLVFGQSTLGAYYQNRSLLSNAALMPIALLLLALLFFLRARLDAHDAAAGSKRSEYLLAVVFLFTLAVQFVIARCAWYKMGWDIANVYTTAEELARGQAPGDPSYFVTCPNNAPLTILQVLPLWAAIKLGLAVPFVVLPYVDAVLLNLSAYLCVQCVRSLTQSRFARGFALVVAIGWIALSPFILYPYTDTWSILFPVSALFVYLRVKRPALKWFLVSLLCFAGAAIKPTVLIFLIALVPVSLCRFFAARDFSLAAWRRVACLLTVLILGMLPGKVFQNRSTAYLAGSAKPEGQLCETHYLMLGMNNETKGGHSPADVDYSLSFPTLSERRAANVLRAWERVRERGFTGNVSFFPPKPSKPITTVPLPRIPAFWIWRFPSAPNRSAPLCAASITRAAA